jgi:peptidoglycan hydrolase-like protein with peptidoglycan-binding domain
MPSEHKMSVANRRQVQEALHHLGYYDGPVDGIFGPLTRAAIRRFQESIGEKSTGHLTAVEASRLVSTSWTPAQPVREERRPPEQCPPCIRHRPFGIAGDWHRLPVARSANTIASKSDRLVFSGQLVKAGLTLIAEAQEFARGDVSRARGIRNGLIIALLAVCPIRLKNFAAPEIGNSFKEIDDRC